jgi:hypothetical protein
MKRIINVFILLLSLLGCSSKNYNDKSYDNFTLIDAIDVKRNDIFIIEIWGGSNFPLLIFNSKDKIDAFFELFNVECSIMTYDLSDYGGNKEDSLAGYMYTLSSCFILLFDKTYQADYSILNHERTKYPPIFIYKDLLYVFPNFLNSNEAIVSNSNIRIEEVYNSESN